MPLQLLDNGSLRALTTAERLELSRAVGGLPAQISHSTVISLDGNYVMAPHTVAGALAFNASSPTVGGRCVMRLTANGVNAPTFPGTKIGAGAYVNTSGTVNVVTVWSPDGSATYYSIEQVAAGSGVSAPDAPTGLTGTAGDGQISFVATAPANNGGAAIDQYRLTVSPGGAQFTGSTPNITATGLTNGQAYTATMAARNSQGYGPESAASASRTPVAPPVGGPAVLRMTGLVNITESGNSTDGYNYVGGGGATSAYSGFGIAANSLAADAPGFVQYTQPASLSTVFLGFKSGSAVPSNKTSFKYGFQPLPTRYAAQLDGVSVTNNGAALTPAPGHIVRLRRAVTSSGVADFILEVSTDGGASFITIHTWAGTNFASQVYPGISATNDPNVAMNFRAEGLS